MKPNSGEVGIVLEPTDITIAKDIFAVVKEKYDGSEALDCMKISQDELFQPGEDGLVAMNEETSKRAFKYAGIALHDVKGKYAILDKRQSYLMDMHLFDTEEYQKGEALIPLLEQRIVTFGSFVAAAEINLDLSKGAVSAETSVHFSH